MMMKIMVDDRANSQLGKSADSLRHVEQVSTSMYYMKIYIYIYVDTAMTQMNEKS